MKTQVVTINAEKEPGGRDRIHRVRLRDKPALGVLSQPGKDPEADAMNAVPTPILYCEHGAKT